MNYVVTYWIKGNKFVTVVDDDGFFELEVRQDNGELSITEVIETSGVLV